jgi:hypothetical protein
MNAEERAAEIRLEILQSARWLSAADDPLLRNTAMTLALAEQVARHLGRLGALDPRGRERRPLQLFMKLQQLLTRQANALGLAPVARAELGVRTTGSALDLARMMALKKGESDGVRRELGAGESDGAEKGDGE